MYNLYYLLQKVNQAVLQEVYHRPWRHLPRVVPVVHQAAALTVTVPRCRPCHHWQASTPTPCTITGPTLPVHTLCYPPQAAFTTITTIRTPQSTTIITSIYLAPCSTLHLWSAHTMTWVSSADPLHPLPSPSSWRRRWTSSVTSLHHPLVESSQLVLTEPSLCEKWLIFVMDKEYWIDC